MDLTQDLFARLLEKGVLAEADPARGRFRAFLRAVCADFLANSRDRENALKRGGRRPDLPIDFRDAEGRYALEPAHELTAERIFDRPGADAARASLIYCEEYEVDGRGSTFEALKAVLTDGSHAGSYAGHRRISRHH